MNALPAASYFYHVGPKFAKENYKLIAYGMDTRIFDAAIKKEFEIC